MADVELFKSKPGGLPREVDRSDVQIYRGKVQRGVKVGGTARGSSELETVSTSELAITFDMSANSVGNAADGAKLVLNVRVLESAAGERVLWRASSESGGTANNEAYWPVLTSEDYSWNPIDIQTLFFRTDTAAAAALFFEITYL